MEHIIYISIILILIYLVFNLYRKNYKQELILIQYLDYMDKLSKVIELSDNKIKELDRNEMFSSDDEIGYFFKTIKSLQNIFNSFTVKTNPLITKDETIK
jgi:hypothetical protein